MKIIPAIDIINGKCVRLTKGDYNKQTIYNENPVEVAKEFEQLGVQYLHLVDLDGAKQKHIVNEKVLEAICTATNLIVDFGGGIKSKEDIELAFNAGANQITIGSIAALQPELFLDWLSVYGSEKIILGADFKHQSIAVSGWESTVEQHPVQFIQDYAGKGVQSVICTDISKDGMLNGPSIDMYKNILSNVDVQLIASGGVTTKKDVMNLQQIGCAGVIVGKAIYEGKINLKEVLEC